MINIRSYIDEKDFLAYSIGSLMYAPALRKNIVSDILANKFIGLSALTLCLEDTIEDSSLEIAENQLLETFKEIDIAYKENPDFSFPMFFIRIRTPEHLKRIYDKIGYLSKYLTGFNLPKFDLSNIAEYSEIICNINNKSNHTIYIMPILESESIISISTRVEVLSKLKKEVDKIKKYVLNIRVGGNDFCNIYGFRRSAQHTVYDIGILNSVLCDILNIFSLDYVVSAPVWEYFDNKNSDEWLTGLKRELILDRLNGFIGKTAIHPSQLIAINQAFKVTYNDYMDAKSILNWTDTMLGVSKSSSSERMNERKVHSRWAEKILILAEVYGVSE